MTMSVWNNQYLYTSLSYKFLAIVDDFPVRSKTE